MKIHGIVSYKGTNYFGWQKQVNETSVQKEIENVLSKVLDTEIIIQGSGRTDAGVHAFRQHFHFEVKKEKEVDLEKLKYSLNCLLPEDIKILDLIFENDDFHARFSSVGKRYIYKMVQLAKDPFRNELFFLNPRPFSIEKYIEAIKLFEGTQNYINFTSKEEDEQNFIRTISSINVEVINDEIITTFEGTGFMRYQIRFMVGTALAVASNDIDISYIKNRLITSENREITHYKAPSQGLYLDEVFY